MVADGHLGIMGMLERTENLGGTLGFESTLGRGTCVRLSLPTTGMVAWLGMARGDMVDGSA